MTSDVEARFAEISVKGKVVKVPAHLIDQRTLIVTGTGLKIARLHEEEWSESQLITDPRPFLEKLRASAIRADIFTFAQTLADPRPRYQYTVGWDDVAAIPITTYENWWEGLPQEARKNVRRAEKRGVVAKLVPFDDTLVQSIKEIYDESPIRQGRPFWHYGKDFATVRRENGTFLERSEFVAAYHETEMIGFLKMVYVGKVARIMQILSKNAHFDKRPPNILLAKAMEACCRKGMTHFVYGQYYYDNKGHTPITEFKRRTGFTQILIARYFIPLTLKGRIAIALKLHRGPKSFIPRPLLNFLLGTRARFNRSSSGKSPSVAEKLSGRTPDAQSNETS